MKIMNGVNHKSQIINRHKKAKTLCDVFILHIVFSLFISSCVPYISDISQASEQPSGASEDLNSTPTTALKNVLDPNDLVSQNHESASSTLFNTEPNLTHEYSNLQMKWEAVLNPELEWHILIKDLTVDLTLMEYAIHDQILPASLIKIPIGMAILKIMEDDGYSPDEFQTLTIKGQSFTALFQSMVSSSDETASRILEEYFNENGRLRMILDDWGLVNTVLFPRASTVDDLRLALEGLYFNHFLSLEMRNYLLFYMAEETWVDAKFFGVMTEYLPGMLLYDKKGYMDTPQVFSDAGLLVYQGHVYLMIVSAQLRANQMSYFKHYRLEFEKLMTLVAQDINNLLGVDMTLQGTSELAPRSNEPTVTQSIQVPESYNNFDPFPGVISKQSENTNAHLFQEELIKLLDEDVSWYGLVRNLDTLEIYFATCTEDVFHPASIIKIPLAMVVLKILEDQGRTISDLSNMGIDGRNFAALLEAMVVFSEEEATDSLEYFARGDNQLKNILTNWGLNQTGFYPRRTTVEDLSTALENLHNGAWLSKDMNDFLLKLMSAPSENDSKYLGVLKDNLDGGVLHNKRGTLGIPTVVADMGILEYAGTSYSIIIVGTTDNSGDSNFSTIEESITLFSIRLADLLRNNTDA